MANKTFPSLPDMKPSRGGVTDLPFSLGYLLLLFLPNILFLLASDRVGWGIEAPAYLLFAVALILFPFGLFPGHHRILLACFLPWTFLAPLHMFFSLLYGTAVDSKLISLVMETNRQEAGEFLSGYVFVLGLLTLLFAAASVFLLRRSPASVPRRLSRATALCCLLAAAAVFAHTHPTPPGQEALSRSRIFANRVSTTYPYGPMLAIVDYVRESRQIARWSKASEGFRFDATKESAADGKEVYVLVLGETARYQNFGVNGYERETTPLLQGLQGLISYTDVRTGAITTTPAVSLMLTRATPREKSPMFSERSLVTAFGEAGFTTFWISSQARRGSTDLLITRFADEADHVVFLDPLNDYGDDALYDESLLPELEKAVRSPSQRIFIVLHTMGSHTRYDARYPEGFDRFVPSSKGTAFPAYSPESRDLLINAYDNSILYTDYVLSRIVRVLEEERHVSLMIYASDHGEDIFDDERELFLHWSDSEYVTRVPLFVWASERYRSTYPEKYLRLRRARTRKISTAANLFETVLDTAGISFAGMGIERSFADPNFRESPRHLLFGNSLQRFDDEGQGP